MKRPKMARFGHESQFGKVVICKGNRDINRSKGAQANLVNCCYP